MQGIGSFAQGIRSSYVRLPSIEVDPILQRKFNPVSSATAPSVAVDVPDSSCHWYIVNADNTFGEGFDWETAPWYSVEGLQDIANLHDQTLESGHQYTMEALQDEGI